MSNYPPITQGDGRSDHYWELVKAHEREQAARRGLAGRRIEFFVDAEVLPRLCLMCKMELPKSSKANQQYCNTMCAQEALRIRRAEADARRAEEAAERAKPLTAQDLRDRYGGAEYARG